MPGLIRKKNDIKVFILYILDLIGYPIDHNTLHDLCVQDNFVSSFDFMDCIHDLCETECVITYKRGEDDCYEITQKGSSVLSALIDDLLPLVRDRALHSANRLLSFEKSGGKVNVKTVKNDNGYTISCEIIKKNKTVLSVSLNVATQALAKRIEHKVNESPEEIYKGISALLLDDISLM